jgi:hypothetical protein
MSKLHVCLYNIFVNCQSWYANSPIFEHFIKVDIRECFNFVRDSFKEKSDKSQRFEINTYLFGWFFDSYKKFNLTAGFDWYLVVIDFALLLSSMTCRKNSKLDQNF